MRTIALPVLSTLLGLLRSRTLLHLEIRLYPDLSKKNCCIFRGLDGKQRTQPGGVWAGGGLMWETCVMIGTIIAQVFHTFAVSGEIHGLSTRSPAA